MIPLIRQEVMLLLGEGDFFVYRSCNLTEYAV